MKDQNHLIQQNSLIVVSRGIIGIASIYNIASLVTSLILSNNLHWLNYLLTSLSFLFLSLLVLTTDDNKKYETKKWLVQTTILPGIIISLIFIGTSEFKLMLERHEHELRIAHLNGMLEATKERNQYYLGHMREMNCSDMK